MSTRPRINTIAIRMRILPERREEKGGYAGMPKYVTIGYGDQAGYEKTPEDLRSGSIRSKKTPMPASASERLRTSEILAACRGKQVPHGIHVDIASVIEARQSQSTFD